ncbi:PP2C family protein-serine/threonine phosphatase [Diaphorobacter aerolatus]|uniref:Serine/threonine-protein phosphatase n=1 Tax=Diaphorobacter aerolatus TaxID=1288495 RepID=A0A7H0GLE0_9BURK|nr:protein phosphatase 2C domain-containing protein [Diaphorobacter aerolatus]QNP49106.1 serine/threonine-protein phosphatase [Diaphorobacter aerolatus]
MTTIQPLPVDEDSVALTHYTLSNQGDRNYNEDAYCHAHDRGIVSFAVADGMGGTSGGRHAAALAVSTIRQSELSLDPNEMSRQFLAISTAIKREQIAHPEMSNMCTTIAELRIDTYSQQAIWAHWGDTRIYWFRNNELVTMTEDHSVVQSLVSAGLLSEEDAANYPKRNVLLGAAGANSEVEPSVLPSAVTVTDGDAFLICTDGVWSMVNTSFIERTLSQAVSVQDWIDEIMKQVALVGSGSNDNFTATGVWITAGSEKTIAMRL